MIGRAAATVAILIAISHPSNAADYAWPVVRVTDGDTVAVDTLSDLPAELANLRVRLRAIDTPEKRPRAKCAADRAAGQAATAYTQAVIALARKIVVRDTAWGKWGGRVVADLVVEGHSHSATLIAAGHGRYYDGRKPDHGVQQTNDVQLTASA